MEIQDTIDAYVRGHLDPAEKADFEAAFQNDPDLVKAVEQARLDFNIANVLIEDEVRGWMQEWETETPAPQKTIPPARTGWKWLGGAVLILFVGGAIWFINRPDSGAGDDSFHTPPKIVPPTTRPIDPNRPVVQQETTTPTTAPVKPELPVTNPRYIAKAEKEFAAIESDSYMRSTDPGQPKNTLQQAAEFIRKKDYSDASNLLRALSATDPDYISAQILLGEVYFRQKKFAAAEQAYTRALRSDKVSDDAVEWNLLMSYLAQYAVKKGDFDLLLNKIAADPDHPDYKQALELQKTIKK